MNKLFFINQTCYNFRYLGNWADTQRELNCTAFLLTKNCTALNCTTTQRDKEELIAAQTAIVESDL